MCTNMSRASATGNSASDLQNTDHFGSFFNLLPVGGTLLITNLQ